MNLLGVILHVLQDVIDTGHRSGINTEYSDFDTFLERGPGSAGIMRRQGGLRHYILAILSRSRMNGSEIISEIQARTMGMWRPSPGSVYPMLSRLENESLVFRETDGRYSITDRGREAIGIGYGRERGLTETDWTIDRILTELENASAYLATLDIRLEEYRNRIARILKSLSESIEE